MMLSFTIDIKTLIELNVHVYWTIGDFYKDK